MEDSMDAGNAKYFRTPMSIKELVLLAGQRKISEINMFLENKQKPSSIPKINPQLLYMEIKSKIPKFDQISNMSFTRNGKLRFATSDPVCAIQILSLDQLFNISVNASVIWEGITSRFLLYKIPTNVSLEELSAELQDSNNFEIVEIRRFIKSGTNPEISPVLITILGTVLPDNVSFGLSIIRFNYSLTNLDNALNVSVFLIHLDFVRVQLYVVIVVLLTQESAL
ncbi:uncharacterized protein TNCV_147801 [Trichonephila clavipes]|nr:uncharacterized protein TNCV_147801 [Trichonephila clavipes]